MTSGSGPTWSASSNAQTNQIMGYGYDAAGNLTNDGDHTYQYDAEGNLLTIDAGNTAAYVLRRAEPEGRGGERRSGRQ